ANTNLLNGARPRGPRRVHAPPNTYNSCFELFRGVARLPQGAARKSSNSRPRGCLGSKATRLTAALQPSRVYRYGKSMFSASAQRLHWGESGDYLGADTSPGKRGAAGAMFGLERSRWLIGESPGDGEQRAGMLARCSW